MRDGKKATGAEVLDRIKKMGYTAGRYIRLYGKQLELLSDPFLQDGLVAVRVRKRSDAANEVVYLPTKMLLGINLSPGTERSQEGFERKAS